MQSPVDLQYSFPTMVGIHHSEYVCFSEIVVQPFPIHIFFLSWSMEFGHELLSLKN